MSAKIKNTFKKASKFFQTKKFFSKKFLMLSLAVAVVVTVGMSVPEHQAQASWLIDIPGSIADYLASWVAGDSKLARLFYTIILAVGNIALWFASVLVYFGAWLVDIMLETSVYDSVLNSVTINIGWTTVRDMCNTFFIFFLLLIAFAMILRIQKFGSTKTLLVKFIMSIFLINFSMVIAKIIIDVGQVFMYEIVTWMPGGFQGKAGSLTTIVEGFNNEINFGIASGLDDVVKVGFAIIYTLMLGLIYIMLAGFLLVRLVMFALLIILSPFAFLSLVLPSMSKYTSEWFDSLVKNALVGPVFLFFVFLSATMANELVSSPPVIASAASTDKLDAISAIVIMIIPNVVALCMLYAVIPISQRLGAAGSKQLIGGTMGIGKIAMGTYAGVKLAGGLGRKAAAGTVGKSKHVQRAQDKLTRGYHDTLSKTGFRGTAMQKKAAYERKKEERMKDKEGKYGDLKSINLNILESKAKSRASGTKEDKALWLKAAAAQGKLGDKENEETAQQFMKYGEHAMSKKEMDEVTDNSLVLAMQTRETKERVDNDGDDNKKSFSEEAQARIDGASTSDEKKEIRREEIEKEKMNDLVEDGKTHKLQDLGDARTARVYDEVVSKEQKKSDRNRMSKKQRDELAEGYSNNILTDAQYSAAKTKESSANPDERKEGKKELEKDFKYKVNAVELGKDLEKTFGRGGADVGKSIEEAFGRFDAKVIGKLSEEQLEKHGHHTTASQWRELDRSNKTTEYNVVLEAKKKRLGVAGISTEERTKLTEQIDRMKGLLTGENR